MLDKASSQESSLVSSAVRGGDHSERVASSTTTCSAMLCVVNRPGKVQAAQYCLQLMRCVRGPRAMSPWV